MITISIIVTLGSFLIGYLFHTREKLRDKYEEEMIRVAKEYDENVDRIKDLHKEVVRLRKIIWELKENE